MDSAHLILDRRIRNDLEAMKAQWESLEGIDLERSTEDPRELIVAGYHLHNLYNAAENIFRNIASTFGNHLDDRRGWHAELLDRMRLDLSPLRPALLDDTTFAQLDELRRFRHVFRSAYGTNLDAERLAIALSRALALHQSFPGQIERFLDFLADIESTTD